MRVALFRWYGVAIVILSLFVSVWLFRELFYNQAKLREHGYTALEVNDFPAGSIFASDQTLALSQCPSDGGKCWREYPFGEAYAPLLGYRPKEDHYPPVGLEATLYFDLSVKENNAWTRLFPSVGSKVLEGLDVELTIDHALQMEGMEALSGKRGAAVFLDVETGAIQAMVSAPSYDPFSLSSSTGKDFENEYYKLEGSSEQPLFNRAIGGNLYPPGSTFKILTSIAMLEKGLVSPDEEVEAPVSVEIMEHAIPNIGYSECGDGYPTFREAFARSCNTPFVLAASSISDEELRSVAERLGFGREQNIPITVTPSKVAHSQSLLEHAETLIGQYDTRVTPLQMAMVVQAIAARGELFEPFLVKKFIGSDGSVRNEESPVSLGQSVEPEIADAIKSMMIEAVEAEYGSARNLNNPVYTVAAKTGTAELGDSKQRTVAWVVGFAPVEDPRIAFAVVVEGDELNPMPHGGDDALPIVKRMLDVVLQSE